VRRKELWLFLLKLPVLTLGFGYIWFSGLQLIYPDLIDPIATPFFRLVGVTNWLLYLLLEHFTNLIPYIALVLASPGLIRNWRRTIYALFGGVAAIVLVHLLLSWLVFELNEAYGLSRAFYRVWVPAYLFNDALPFGLWLLFYPELPGRLFGLRIFGHKS